MVCNFKYIFVQFAITIILNHQFYPLSLTQGTKRWSADEGGSRFKSWKGEKIVTNEYTHTHTHKVGLLISLNI